MSESKHTPGRWWASDSTLFSDAHGTIGNFAAFGGSRIFWRDPERSEANARLAAAAPDMYEALKAARRQLVSLFGDIQEGATGLASVELNNTTLRAIDAALAKAEGGT